MKPIIQEILESDKKHKEKVALITRAINNDTKLVDRLFELLTTGVDVNKGTAAEVMKFISAEKP